ncbi:MAG: flagellar biosynthetic protein FliP [Proteobacteria bacterium]|nr:flagellar biosynthetic protein FliP [Pseudomonadota bacterium]
MRPYRRAVVLCALFFLALAGVALAQNAPELTLPTIKIEEGGKGGGGLATPLQILMLMTVLSLAPYILVMTTSFIRISIVLSFLRTAMGTQQVPPTQVLMALSLFMTLYIMSPVGKRINETALQPYFSNKIKQAEFIDRASSPLKDFMFANTRKTDIVLFFRLSNLKEKEFPAIEKPADVPIHIMLPSYIVSEIKTAFAIGFLLYIPFLVIDMVVASVLMSMGMFMLSPMTISLPFKLLLFVMINGWEIILEGLVKSFKQPVY